MASSSPTSSTKLNKDEQDTEPGFIDPADPQWREVVDILKNVTPAYSAVLSRLTPEHAERFKSGDRSPESIEWLQETLKPLTPEQILWATHPDRALKKDPLVKFSIVLKVNQDNRLLDELLIGLQGTRSLHRLHRRTKHRIVLW